MRTNMTMKATMGLIGGIVLVAAGCTVKTSTGGGNHTLAASILPSVPPNSCAIVAGPASVPDLTDMAYSIHNDFLDDFDAGVDLGDCSLYYAYGIAPGTDVAESETVPFGTYYLEINCLGNGGNFCQPTVDYWTADY
jgi:hypothetical protein